MTMKVETPTRPQLLSTNSFSRGDRLAWLDGLRAIAISGVIIIHAGMILRGISTPLNPWINLGQYGVQLFFVISTITIDLTLSSSKSLPNWYIRRFMRIAPLYYFGIVVYFFVNMAMYKMGKSTAQFMDLRAIISNIFFIHGFVPIGNNSVVPGGWSIAIEMSFYLIAPSLYILMRKLNIIQGILFASITSGILLTITHISSKASVVNNSYFYFWPPTQLPIFIFGTFFVVNFGRRVFSEKFSPLLLILSIILFCAAAALGVVGNLGHGFAPLFVSIAMWLFIMSAGSFKEIFSNTPLTHIGKISYSVYINHFFVLFSIKFLLNRAFKDNYPGGNILWYLLVIMISFPITVIISNYTFIWIETPFVNWSKNIKLNKSLISRD